jgi:hypothetical protein
MSNITLGELIQRADENHHQFNWRERGYSRLPLPSMSTHVHETMLREGPTDADWAKDLIHLLPRSDKEKVTTFSRSSASNKDWPSGLPMWSTV